MANENNTIEEVNNENIKAIEYNLNTGNGISNLITSKINGFLETVTIFANRNVHVIISTSEEEYIILDKNIRTPVERIALREDTFAANGELFNYGRDKIALDNQLIITVKGSKDIDIKCILRMS